MTSPQEADTRAADLEARVEKALKILAVQSDGDIDHKDWAIDQAIRALAGDKYDELVKTVCPEGGPFIWTVGRKKTG